MKKIVLDTNFLTIPYQFGVDIFDQIDHLVPGEKEYIVLEGVSRELEKLTNKEGKHSIAAKIGLEMIEKHDIKVIKDLKNNVDDSIVDLADQKNTLVATNDRELIKRLKNKSIQVIYLRAEKRLEMR